MSKVLLFTTSFSNNIESWNNRYLKWFKYYTKSSLYYNKLLIVDDGSPILPDWSDLRIYKDSFEIEPAEKFIMYSFNQNLGRPALLDYPGWYRSYSFASRYAKKYNYDKIIHIESDAYLLTHKLINHINNLEEGWSVMWCPRHNFPENALQIICKDNIDIFYKTLLNNYSAFKGKDIERCLPYTNIINTFTGDRYGEYLDYIPENADYICQLPENFKI